MMYDYPDKIVQFNLTVFHATAPPFRVNIDFNADFLTFLRIKNSVSDKDQILNIIQEHVVF